MVGECIITNNGVRAFVDASGTGANIKPEYYIVTHENISLDPTLITLEGWRQDNISAYIPVNENTIEFIINIPVEDALNYGTTFGLFLDDDTLFMLAKPPYPLPPALRQIFKIQLVYKDSQALVDFSYIPFDQTEQDLSRLEEITQNGSRTLMFMDKINKMEAKLSNMTDFLSIFFDIPPERFLDVYPRTHIDIQFHKIQLEFWRIRDTGTVKDIRSIACSDNRIVAIARDGFIFYSDNGISWSIATVEENDIDQVIYVNGFFIMIGGSLKIFRSSDGINWENIFDQEDLRDAYSIVYANNLFVIGIYNGSILTSADAVTWTHHETDMQLQHTKNLTFGNNLFIFAFGHSVSIHEGNIDMDKNWTNVRLDDFDFKSLTFANGLFVAGGADGEIYISTNGTEWTKNIMPTLAENREDITTITHTGHFFVAGTSKGTILYSMDAINWTIVNTPADKYISSIIFYNNRFIAGVYYGKFLNTI